MSSPLTASINTDKVNTGLATNIASIRIQAPRAMMCPAWTGHDNFGRPVSSSTFTSSMEGCSLPSDRINTENLQRPQYANFVTLNAAGIAGGPEIPPSQRAIQIKQNVLESGFQSLYGSAGLNLGSKVREVSRNQMFMDEMAAPLNESERLSQMARVGAVSNVMYSLGGETGMGPTRRQSAYARAFKDLDSSSIEGYRHVGYGQAHGYGSPRGGSYGKEGYCGCQMESYQAADTSSLAKAQSQLMCFEQFKEHGNLDQYEKCLKQA